MRLALTRSPVVIPSAASGGTGGTAAAAPWRSEHALPSVFEQVYAGQTLRCLAVVVGAPRGSVVVAVMEPPGNRGGAVVGEAKAGGEEGGRVDLVVEATLREVGQHELVVVVQAAQTQTQQQREVLRKVYRIQVAAAFTAVVSPASVGNLVSCKITNVTRNLPMCVSRVGGSRRAEPSVMMFPGEAYSFVVDRALLRERRNVVEVEWTGGLGEHGVSDVVVPSHLHHHHHSHSPFADSSSSPQVCVTSFAPGVQRVGTPWVAHDVGRVENNNNNPPEGGASNGPEEAATHADVLMHGPFGRSKAMVPLRRGRVVRGTAAVSESDGGQGGGGVGEEEGEWEWGVVVP